MLMKQGSSVVPTGVTDNLDVLDSWSVPLMRIFLGVITLVLCWDVCCKSRNGNGNGAGNGSGNGPPGPVLADVDAWRCYHCWIRLATDLGDTDANASWYVEIPGTWDEEEDGSQGHRVIFCCLWCRLCEIDPLLRGDEDYAAQE